LKIKDGRQGENHQEFTQEEIRFTQKTGKLYAFLLSPPTKEIHIKTLATAGLLEQEIAEITLFGSEEKIEWSRSASGLTLQLPKKMPAQPVIGFCMTLK
jgi:alpha-L-fucosidase